MSRQPGPVLGSGRSWVVYDLGDGCFDSDDPAVEPMITAVREPLLSAFLGGVDRPAAASSLREAARIRHDDPATRPEERRRIDQLCRDHAL